MKTGLLISTSLSVLIATVALAQSPDGRQDRTGTSPSEGSSSSTPSTGSDARPTAADTRDSNRASGAATGTIGRNDGPDERDATGVRTEGSNAPGNSADSSGRTPTQLNDRNDTTRRQGDARSNSSETSADRDRAASER